MNIWSRARELAAQTPAERNRYVDFLRAVSIVVVIVGHWLIQAIYYADGEMTFGHLFEVQPWTQWLTWAFQVMPVFFIVGGYSNAVSLESAQRKGLGYAGWLSARLSRLMTPLIVLLVTWGILALLLRLLGTDAALVQLITAAALIPTWFLAIYIMVVLLAPLMYRFWRRLGFVSTAILVAVAVILDYAFFALDIRWPSWSNYFWIWLAIHSLGFAWRDGRLGSAWHHLLYAAVGLDALWMLVFLGPYPLPMVGFPGIEISNTTPPKITLLALGLFQFSLLMLIEKPMRRALDGLGLWTATVLINSMIMTIYLWHITLSILLIALLYWAGGVGLGVEPGSAGWWGTRPLWILALWVLLLPAALLLSPLERLSRGADAPTVAAWRQVGGAMMFCLGVALLARFGYGNAPVAGLDVGAIGLVVAGAALAGVLSVFRRA
ncbi:MAG: acyltransferase [Gammaproteobacteria bacterium]|nr:acyltransferase [Gammaproteobacteria bacterium]